MAKQIIVKPLVTEKTDALAEDKLQYTFVVNKKANKIEIRKAVEKMFDVKVRTVNTAVMPAKMKSRNTRSGLVRGRVSGFKKAIITLAEGELDFYGSDNAGEEDGSVDE